MTTDIDFWELSPEARVSERIAQLMWRHKITQTRMAEAMGVTQSAISLKLGGVSRWTLRDVIKVTDTLDVTLENALAHILGKEKSRPAGAGRENARPEGLEPPTF